MSAEDRINRARRMVGALVITLALGACVPEAVAPSPTTTSTTTTSTTLETTTTTAACVDPALVTYTVTMVAVGPAEAAVLSAIMEANGSSTIEALDLITSVPSTILSGMSLDEAAAGADILTGAGALVDISPEQVACETTTTTTTTSTTTSTTTTIVAATYSVQLDAVGGQAASVLRVLMELTGLSSIDARALMVQAPVIILRGVSKTTAVEAVRRLSEVGALASEFSE